MSLYAIKYLLAAFFLISMVFPLNATPSAPSLHLFERNDRQALNPSLIQEAALHPQILEEAAPILSDLAAREAMAPKIIARISLAEQKMRLSIEGEITYEWAVSTARRGYRTPTGLWQPYRMHKMWYSRKYDNAPMPHSIFFTGGYAIHGTPHIKRLGQPASHGCIRLHPEHARTLFDLVRLHGRAKTWVVIDP